MTEAGRKLVVDRRGVTIVGDRFRFSASATPRDGTEPDLDGLVAEATGSSDVEDVITGLQSMTRLTYGQYCALSRALELVGERWSMLLVRDLLVGPKTVGELRAGLPRIPAGTLLSRLRELEHGRVVRKDGQSFSDDVRVELTEYGQELDEIVVRLGRWGTRLLGSFRPDDAVSANAVVMALRVAFQPGSATTASFQIDLGRQGAVHGSVVDGVLSAGLGPVPGGADLVLRPGRSLRVLMSGELDPDQALRSGVVKVTGDPALLRTFTELFQISPALPHLAAN